MRESALLVAALLLSPPACAPPPEGPLLARTPPYPSAVAHQVDPFIGTAGEGYTFPGAAAPWGLVSASPHNLYLSAKASLLSWRFAPAGYRRGEPALYGLGLTQLSGVGCPDLGSPVVMATVGELRPGLEERRSRYLSSEEVAWPGYYGVYLQDAETLVEATAGTWTAVVRFRFPPREGDANVLVDAGSDLSWLASSANRVRILSDRELEGSSETGLFCFQPNRQTVHFVGRFNRAAARSGTWRDGAVTGDPEAVGTDVGGYFRFSTSEEPVELVVGISYVSAANARRNLEAELTGADGGSFEHLRARAFSAWDQALSRVRVSGGSEEAHRLFYTGLYHMLLHPSVLSDANGEHPTPDGVGIAPAGDQRHTIFSLWDTYRNVHPFLTLVFPERQQAMLRTIAAWAGQHGRPPKWELIDQEVNMMVGDPVIPVVADSYLKGLTGFDAQGLYAILRDGALDVAGQPPHRPGNPSYRSLGYIPMEQADDVWGPVSTTLEYAHADWALSRLARALGHDQDAKLFEAQAKAYANLFDASTGLLRPKNADGSWYAPFDPTAMQGSGVGRNSGGPGYVEGTAWHYAFFVPHDVKGLAALHGGDAAFVQRLQRVFDEDHFTLWNEPDIAYPYLFTYFSGEAWRTQREVHRARRAFTTGADGLPGNDDAGTLSAWYVLSAMGLYPDCPGSARYSLTTPLFPRVEIQLHPSFHRGQRFVIEAPRSSPDQIYVRRMNLDGRPHAVPYLTHDQITAGGTLQLELTDAAP